MFSSLDTSHLIIALVVFALTVAGIAVLTPRAPRRDTVQRELEKAEFRRRIEERLDVHEAKSAEPASAADPETYRPKGFQRVFKIIFIIGWLIGWSAGIVFVFSSLMEEGGDSSRIFLACWLLAAVAAWIYVIYILIKLIRGDPIPRPRNSGF
ncbi:MAG: hypothetical protein AAGD23_09380 [Pseudomonadota bacterium]